MTLLGDVVNTIRCMCVNKDYHIIVRIVKTESKRIMIFRNKCTRGMEEIIIHAKHPVYSSHVLLHTIGGLIIN